MKKPVIGIPGAHMTNNEGSAPVSVDYVNHAYCAGIENAGGVPLLLPVVKDLADLDQILAMCDGLLIPGGIDVDPRFYHEDPSALLGSIDSAMDLFWIHAANYALEHKMPVLGICRGLQLVNVAFGGSLYQDLSYMNPGHMLHSQNQNRDQLIHKVTMDPDSHLASIIGPEPVYTNTMHHQCVKEPGKGLRITAHTADGIPEALETADGQFILVQWHPEELQDSEPRMRGLFKDLVEKAKKQA